MKLFTFPELSETAKEAAIQKYSGTADSDWWDSVYEDAVAVAELIGIIINEDNKGKPEIRFSGFWSQGDGASFTGSYAYRRDSVNLVSSYTGGDKVLVAIASQLSKIQRKHFYGLTAEIGTHPGNYYHSHMMRANVINSQGHELPDDVESDILEQMRAFADWVYRQLEHEYEYQNSEDAVAELAEVNDWLFNEEGVLQ